MTSEKAYPDILKDKPIAGQPGAAFVTFGETMVRETPADQERLERTRQAWVSLAGSELSTAITLSRLGVSAEYITRVPDNPYGWMVQNTAREQGVRADHFAWADRTDLIGRYLYELGRSPRPGVGWYQRKHSAASRLGPGMVDWKEALQSARLLHTSGISFGLSTHSGYERNYLLETFYEALSARPSNCLVSLDFNYRSTLWTVEQCKQALLPLIGEHVDVLVTTIPDVIQFFGLHSGKLDASALVKEETPRPEDGELQDLMGQMMRLYPLKKIALTIRYSDSHEQHRWESAAMDSAGNYFRSPEIRSIILADRLGGGDAWTGGFFYSLLTESDPLYALEKGVLVGDAATRLKQTMMYDLPVINRSELQALLKADVEGGGKRTSR